MGKVAREARRIGCWRYENEREKASETGNKRKHPSTAGAFPFPEAEGGETRIPLSPYRHFERSEKSSLQTDQRWM